jgi:hypothetical protein
MRKIFAAVLLLIVSYGNSFAITKKVIKLSELPAAVTTDILKRYPAYSIIEAYKVNDKNIMTFEVIISLKEVRSIVYYNSESKFIRRINFPSPIKKGKNR